MEDFEKGLFKAWGKEHADLVEHVAAATREMITEPLAERHDGALRRGSERAGLPDDPSRRHFLQSVLLFGTDAAMTRIAAGAAVAGAALATVPIVQTYRAEERGRFEVRQQFANAVASASYPDLSSISSLTASNEGEQALLDSITTYNQGDVQGLSAAQTNLEAAASCTRNPDAKAIVLWRQMTDSNFFGDSAKSTAVLKQIDFSTIISTEIVLKILDGGTALALNAMEPSGFIRCESDLLDHLEAGWNRLGWNLATAADIAGCYRPGREGTLGSAAQRNGLELIRHLPLDASMGEIRAAREAWFEQLREKTNRLDGVAPNAAIGGDFLQSLTRPTFHAAASGDLAHMAKLLDYYFGRTSYPDDIGAIDSARREIQRAWRGNSPWMLLLDLVHSESAVAQKRLDSFLTNANYRLPNQQLLKAFSATGRRLGVDERLLQSRLAISYLKTDVPETTLYRTYLDQLDPKS